MIRTRFIVIFAVVFVATILVLMIPTTQFERSVDIHASDSLVRVNTERFKTYFDSSVVKLCSFDYKVRGDTTRLIWVFTPEDMDNPLVKIYWLYKRDKWQTEVMDRGLNNIKKACEGTGR